MRSRTYALSLGLFRYLRGMQSTSTSCTRTATTRWWVTRAVRSGLPLVFTPHYHGTGHTPFRTFLHRLYRGAGATVRAAHAIICVSHARTRASGSRISRSGRKAGQ